MHISNASLFREAFQIILVRFRLLSKVATFWEIAAHSVDHMFSFVF